MTTTFSNTAAVSGALSITSLSTLASGAYSNPSAAFDNSAGTSYNRGLVRLGGAASLTAGAGSPYFTLYRLGIIDGTNWPLPPGNAASAPSPNALQSIVQLVPSAAFQYLDFGPFDLGPFKYSFMFLNQAGVALSGTWVATLYRWTEQGA